MSSEGERVETPPSIEMSFSSVIGPVLYKKQIPDDLADRMVDQVFDFYIPAAMFKGITRSSISSSLIGMDVYPSGTPLTYIAVHQGVVELDEVPNYFRCINSYDGDFALSAQDRRAVSSTQITGVQLLIQVVPRFGRYEGGKQFDIKSKSSKTTAHGFVFIFGQPVVGEPVCIRMNDLYGLGLETKVLQSDEHWLRFGLTGEAMSCYKLGDFQDDGLPSSEWLFARLKKNCLYLDTDCNRYELAMAANGQSLRLCKMHYPLISVARTKADATPTREPVKDTCEEGISWLDVKWSETGITVNGTEYGPFLSYFWAKRKRGIP